MSALATVDVLPDIPASDQQLIWMMRRFLATYRVLLPEQAASLFGAICSAVPNLDVVMKARLAFFQYLPDWVEKAKKVGVLPDEAPVSANRRGCFDDATEKLQRRNASLLANA